METVEVVIRIPKKKLENLQRIANGTWGLMNLNSEEIAILNGTVLPKEHGWIPVSERLPEETGWYLVTFRVYGGGYAVCELSYRKPENYWTDKDIFKKALSNDEILAWMPLPERYKDGD